jgi:hypothetical protein
MVPVMIIPRLGEMRTVSTSIGSENGKALRTHSATIMREVSTGERPERRARSRRRRGVV